MNVTVNGAKVYAYLNGKPFITQTTVSSFVVMVLLVTVGYFLGRNLQKRPGRMQVVTEKLVTMLYDMVGDTMGKHNLHWAPYIGTLMLSSVCGSLIGMTGFLRSSTADLMTIAVWALMTSCFCWYYNAKNQGWSWFKSLLNPMNLISEVAQPVSMTFRHFGNIMGGGVLTSLIYAALAVASSAVLRLVSGTVVVPILVIAVGAALLVWGIRKKKLIRKILGIAFAVIGVFGLVTCFTDLLKGIPFLSVGLPGVLSLYFDVFTGGIQALVFSLLTMVYVGMAATPAEEEAQK